MFILTKKVCRMALIRCPECGATISNNAQTCIYCGYPIREHLQDNNLYDIIYKGLTISRPNTTQISVISNTLKQLLTDCDWQEAQNIILNPPYYILEGITKDNAEWVMRVLSTCKCKLKIQHSHENTPSLDNHKLSRMSKSGSDVICPYCGSTSVTAGQRGFSVWTGFLGSGQTVLRCSKCAATWKP